jgi:hypothetical protein
MNALASQASGVPAATIDFSEITAPADRRKAADGKTTLVFRLGADDPERLEALREARRAMIREGRNEGIDETEPSLAEAVFSKSWVFWEVPIGDQFQCREKLAALVRRANRLVEESQARKPS